MKKSELPRAGRAMMADSGGIPVGAVLSTLYRHTLNQLQACEDTFRG